MSFWVVPVVVVAASCRASPPVPQAKGTDDLPCRWERPRWSLVVEHPTPEMASVGRRIADAVRESFEGWGLEVAVEVTVGLGPAAEDGRNTVTLASSDELQLLDGREGDLDGRTLLYTRRGQGGDSAEIVEADILIRADAIAWGDPAENAPLGALVLHEVGHFVGLDHVCFEHGEGSPATPNCSVLGGATNWVMRPRALRTDGPLALQPNEHELEKVRELYDD